MFGKISQQNTGEIDDAVLTVTEKDAAKIEWPLRRELAGRYIAVAVVILAILFGRAAYLTVFQGEKYAAMARENSIRQIPVPAPRGIIYDRFGEPLVKNTPSIGAVLVPFDAPKDAVGRDNLRERIVNILHADRETVDAAFRFAGNNPLTPVPLKEKLSQEEAIDFYSRRKDLPGVSLYKTVYREYPDGLIFSHALGYEGKITEDEFKSGDGRYLPTDMIGKQGVEKGYESDLRGVRGYDRVEVDALGQVKKSLGSVTPVPGNDLFLNIDNGLQKKAYDSLQATLESKSLSRGAVVALDPGDGSVLALVSVPGFDNNLFSEGISSAAYQSLINDEAKPLFDRAIAGTYAPGSTFKPVMAAAALSEHVIDERTQIESKGSISIGNFTFGDWRVNGFTDMRRAIAVSSDVYFYSVGGGYGGIQGLGINRMKDYASRFGYGTKTGIDVPGEADGFLADPEWKKRVMGEPWYIGDDYHTAIGQGFTTATPLQILNSVTAIANGGTLYVPHVVSQVRGADGKTVAIPPRVIRSGFVNPDILKVVREGMRQTVTEGTAQPLNALPLPVAGKTGTAQFGTGNKTDGWFVSFAPYDDPKIAIIVLVEAQEGNEDYNTVPVAKDIYDWYFRERLGVGKEVNL
ncbi:MAG: penicillin-binding protein 2 [Candidatus Moranbacteria bacterium]|nr:penicillin-binding protein 2 [Candidatus Moranbacteria bacterium]